MRKRLTYLLLFVIPLVSLLPKLNVNASGNDSINIVSLGVMDENGQLTLRVEVDYNLSSADSGELSIGFNTEEVNSFMLINDADHIVNKGKGRHVFYVSTIAKDWGDDGEFQVYVNISEYPHPESWTPLASDYREVLPSDSPNSDKTIKWILEPSLHYEEIDYCQQHGIFARTTVGSFLLDTKTGEIAAEEVGHGGYYSLFVFDEKQDLLGYMDDMGGVYLWPRSQYLNEATIDGMLRVYKIRLINSFIEDQNFYEYDYIPIGGYALMYKGEFVTDFVYEKIENHVIGDLAAVQENDKWGFVDEKGSVAIPFVFENAVSIDENTAFAKYNGLYGILDKVGTAERLKQDSSNILPEPKDEAQKTDGYIYTNPVSNEESESIVFDYTDDLHKITSKRKAVDLVKELVSNIPFKEKQNSKTIDMLTLFTENAISKASEIEVKGKSISITEKLLAKSAEDAKNTQTEIAEIIEEADIQHLRVNRTGIQVNTPEKKRVTVSFDKTIEDIDADRINLVTPFTTVSIDKDEVKPNLEIHVENIEEKEENLFLLIYGLVISILLVLIWLVLSKVFNLKIKIWKVLLLCGLIISINIVTFIFGVGKGKPSDGVLVKMNNESMITLSMEPDTKRNREDLIVVDEKGNPVASKYNPITNTIDAIINKSATYSVERGSADFSDIENLSNEMQNAILYLAKHQIMEGASTYEFCPDDPITRAEFISVLARAIGLTPLNSNQNFDDISANDWYAELISAAKEAGLTAGVGNNMFDGQELLPKDQLVVFAARTLVMEMGYFYPDRIEEILKVYRDRVDLAKWSENDIALSTQNNIVIHRADGFFLPNDTMTRGDAAIILKRTLDRIW